MISDVQVDFALLDWPAPNDVRVGLFADWPVELVSFPDGQYYITHFSDGIQGNIPTTDTSGKLRIMRTGTALTGYYGQAGQWIVVHSSGVSLADLPFGIQIWSHDWALSYQFVKVAFDNFIVNQGQMICPGSVSGRVTDAGNSPIAGVTVSAGAAGSTTTDRKGAYTIGGLAAGTYTPGPAGTWQSGW